MNALRQRLLSAGVLAESILRNSAASWRPCNWRTGALRAGTLALVVRTAIDASLNAGRQLSSVTPALCLTASRSPAIMQDPRASGRDAPWIGRMDTASLNPDHLTFVAVYARRVLEFFRLGFYWNLGFGIWD